MNTKFLLTVIVVSLFACGSPQESAEVPSNVARTVVEVSDMEAGTNRADLAISGMTCEVMCGGAIKKALTKLDGVQATEIKFDIENELDHAIVTFSSADISEAELIAAVNGIHDGIYSVKKLTLETPSASSSGGSSSSDVRADGSISSDLPTIQMPNLMDMITRILRF